MCMWIGKSAQHEPPDQILPCAPRGSGRGEGARDLTDVLAASVGRANTLGAVRAAVAVLCDRPDISAAVRALPAPALVVLGDEDVSAPPEELRRVWAPAVAAGRAEVIKVAGTGHSSALEAPERVAGALEAFARRVLPPRLA